MMSSLVRFSSRPSASPSPSPRPDRGRSADGAGAEKSITGTWKESGVPSTVSVGAAPFDPFAGTASAGAAAFDPPPKSIVSPAKGSAVLSAGLSAGFGGESADRSSSDWAGSRSSVIWPILALKRYSPGVWFPPRRVLERAQLRQDVAPDRLESFGILDLDDAGDDLLRAGIGELAEAIDDLLGRVARQVDRLEVRPLDLVVVSPDGLAMLAQDLVLVVDLLGAAEDVGGVGVLGHEAERLSLAAAADQDRDPRPRDRLRRVAQPLRVVLAPVEPALAAALALPHLVGDLERLVVHLEPLAERREREAEPARLLLVPGRADPEPGAAARQHVEGRRGLHPEARVAVVDAAD